MTECHQAYRALRENLAHRAGSRAMPLYGQAGNAQRHSLVLENQELAHVRDMGVRMQIHVPAAVLARSEFYEGRHEVRGAGWREYRGKFVFEF